MRTIKCIVSAGHATSTPFVSKIFHRKHHPFSGTADALAGKSSDIAVPQTISFAAPTIAYTTGDLF
ncbi:MAG TPA: hypothetical protein VEY06_10625 [Flavisolibacter sp.]|nr:hypothetical protein [Flavisolibacter sp.]